jgi:hypothetical protein
MLRHAAEQSPPLMQRVGSPWHWQQSFAPTGVEVGGLVGVRVGVVAGGLVGVRVGVGASVDVLVETAVGTGLAMLTPSEPWPPSPKRRTSVVGAGVTVGVLPGAMVGVRVGVRVGVWVWSV